MIRSSLLAGTANRSSPSGTTEAEGGEARRPPGFESEACYAGSSHVDGAMILLQEAEKTVSFNPTGICYGPVPWYEAAFRFYLLFMLLVLVTRGIQISWNLLCLRRFQREGVAAIPRFREVWLAANARADALRRFSVLTLVLVLADFCFAAASILAQVSMQKFSTFGAISGATASQLRTSAMGLLACAALYAANFFFHGCLVRRERCFAKESSADLAVELPHIAPRD